MMEKEDKGEIKEITVDEDVSKDKKAPKHKKVSSEPKHAKEPDETTDKFVVLRNDRYGRDNILSLRRSGFIDADFIFTIEERDQLIAAIKGVK